MSNLLDGASEDEKATRRAIGELVYKTTLAIAQAQYDLTLPLANVYAIGAAFRASWKDWEYRKDH